MRLGLAAVNRARQPPRSARALAVQRWALNLNALELVGAVGIELSIDLTKSHAFTVLLTAGQMNWS